MKGYTNRTGLFYEYWLEVLIGNESVPDWYSSDMQS